MFYFDLVRAFILTQGLLYPLQHLFWMLPSTDRVGGGQTQGLAVLERAVCQSPDQFSRDPTPSPMGSSLRWSSVKLLVPSLVQFIFIFSTACQLNILCIVHVRTVTQNYVMSLATSMMLMQRMKNIERTNSPTCLLNFVFSSLLFPHMFMNTIAALIKNCVAHLLSFMHF